MKLVLDTNVVLEIFHWQDPRCSPLASALASGRARCLTDDACLAELRRVLAYPQFERDEAAQQALYAHYSGLAENVGMTADPLPVLPKCRDADDQKFVELAMRSGAGLLVTRDRELLRLARSRRHPLPFAILTPEGANLRLASSPETPA